MCNVQRAACNVQRKSSPHLMHVYYEIHQQFADTLGWTKAKFEERRVRMGGWRGLNGVCTSIYQQPERSIPKHLPASDASKDDAALCSSCFSSSWCCCLPDLDLCLCLAANERENNARNVEQQQQQQGSDSGQPGQPDPWPRLPTSTVVATDRIIIN